MATTPITASNGHAPTPLELDARLALEHSYRLEMAKLNAIIMRYREILLMHGIEPPDSSGEIELAHFKACRRAAEIAYYLLDTPELHDALAEIRTIT